MTGNKEMAESQTPQELPEVVDENPQRRREWVGPFRSVVLPILVVAAIVGGIFYFETRDSGPSATPAGSNGAQLGIVALPPEKNATGDKPEAKEGKPAPDFVLKTLDGETVRLSDLQGQAVLINFWATWCTPCRREMPEIQTVYEEYKDQGFVVIAVNIQESSEQVRAWAEEFGLTFPIAMDSTGAVTNEYLLLDVLPTTVFVGRDGVIKSIYRGQMDQKIILDNLQKIL